MVKMVGNNFDHSPSKIIHLPRYSHPLQLLALKITFTLIAFAIGRKKPSVNQTEKG